jgi:putative heme-binding domain-containing protein
MRLLLTIIALALSCTPAAGQRFAPNEVKSKPLSPSEQQKAFVLPEGLEIQLVASEPDIQKPMNLAFDNKGRIWVTGSVEYPIPAKGEGRDEVRILERFGPDGKAGKVSSFARGLNIPIGLLPLGDESALTFSIPNIWRVSARGKEKLFTGFGFEDTHGMTSAFTPGFDGWVYACHGFANTSEVRSLGKDVVKMRSGNTYRMKADGSRIEQFTWGQVNPFGLSFDRWGNLYSADCHTQPIYQLLRGAWYPSFGAPHDGLGFGPAMVTGFKGSTAIAGVAVYEAGLFPKEYQGSAFVGDVMTNEVVRFEIRHEGTTPIARAVPFLQCKDQWFRPVDVKLGPDGALYIADFYNCIIGHYEVPLKHPARDRHRGRIWRVTYKGKGGAGSWDYARAKEEELVSILAQPNLTARMKAADELVARGEKASEPVRAELKKPPEGAQHAHLIWVAHRLGCLSDEALARAMSSRDELVRVHALRVAGESGRMPEAVRKCLTDDAPRARRAAAEALSLSPAAENVKPLLGLLAEAHVADTHLRHVARMALRNQLHSDKAWAVVDRLGSQSERAQVADVLVGLKSSRAAAWIAGHLETLKASGPALEALVRHAARHGEEPARERVLRFLEGQAGLGLREQARMILAYLRGLQEAGARPTEAAASIAEGAVKGLLASKDDQEVLVGAELCGQAGLASFQPELVRVAQSTRPPGARLAAAQALASLDGPRNARTLGGLILDEKLPHAEREQVAALLGRVKHEAARSALAAALVAAPARVQGAIAASLATDRDGAMALVQAMEQGKASARLLLHRQVKDRLAGVKALGLAERVNRLSQGLPDPDANLEKLIESRRASFTRSRPSLEKGAALFHKHCAACHQVDGKGAKHGPQLDGIGLRGAGRLIEDILDPGRNVDQAFRATTVHTRKGLVIQGLVLREEGEVLVLADEKGKEVRIPRADVEMRAVTNLSPMPANFGEALSESELTDLVGWLMTKRTAKP